MLGTELGKRWQLGGISLSKMGFSLNSSKGLWRQQLVSPYGQEAKEQTAKLPTRLGRCFL